MGLLHGVSVICQGVPLASCFPVSRPLRSQSNMTCGISVSGYDLLPSPPGVRFTALVAAEWSHRIRN